MSRNLIILIVVVAVGIVAAWFFLAGGQDSPQRGDAPETQTEEDALSFDTVRIESDGTGLVAGRAPARAEVTLLDRGQEVASTDSSARGEWVVTIDEPLRPGSAELTLRARLPNGEIINSSQRLAIVVGDDDERMAVVSDVDGGAGSRILQGTGQAASESGDLLLETIDYGRDKRITLSGKSVAPRTVRAYLDNRYIGESPVNRTTERWSLVTRDEIAEGNYTVRLDQIDDTGAVRSRISLPFTKIYRGISGVVEIEKGDNLWTISRKLYGQGHLYTVIYEMNKDQIRDPDLIYPEQVFSTPKQ